jgi:cephalosporin-C deacetylase
MAMFDMPLSQLEQYRPDVAEPSDFDAFWQAS